MDPRSDTAPTLVAIALLLLVVGGVVAAVVIVFDPRILPGCKLDQDRWQEARQLAEQGHTADAFEKAEPEVEDIVNCDDLVYGKSRREVIQLLGAPDSGPKKVTYAHYDVGVPEFSSDYPGLDIRFDSSGHADEAAVSGYVEP